MPIKKKHNNNKKKIQKKTNNEQIISSYSSFSTYENINGNQKKTHNYIKKFKNNYGKYYEEGFLLPNGKYDVKTISQDINPTTPIKEVLYKQIHKKELNDSNNIYNNFTYFPQFRRNLLDFKKYI